MPESDLRIKKRQSRYKSSPGRYNLRIRERDITILSTILAERILTSSQIARLFFGRLNATGARLHQLWNEGYLQRDFFPVLFGSSEAIYSVTSKGVQLLSKVLEVSPKDLGWNPKAYKITNWKKEHELEVNEIKVALILALAEHFNFWLPKKGESKGSLLTHNVPDLDSVGKILYFDKGRRYEDKVRVKDPEARDKSIPIMPDRFMILNLGEASTFGFWEIDRGTMEEKRFERKLRGYLEYYFSGKFLSKYGEQGARIEDYPFRVFTIVPDEIRRIRLLLKTIELNSNFMMWFAVKDDFLASPIGNIWLRGIDFKKAFEALSSELQEELQKPTGRPGLRFMKALEELQQNATKHSLLSGV